MLADRVAQQLEEQIRAGRLHPGEKLPTEAELVRQLGVSRTVVREAVSRLHSRNLVEPRQGSGVYVKAAGIEPLDLDSLRQTQQDAVIQIAEVRRALSDQGGAVFVGAAISAFKRALGFVEQDGQWRPKFV